MGLKKITKEDFEDLADYARSVNPNLKGMDLLRTNLTHDELPVY